MLPVQREMLTQQMLRGIEPYLGTHTHKNPFSAGNLTMTVQKLSDTWHVPVLKTEKQQTKRNILKKNKTTTSQETVVRFKSMLIYLSRNFCN